jgi:hypothetical protein
MTSGKQGWKRASRQGSRAIGVMLCVVVWTTLGGEAGPSAPAELGPSGVSREQTAALTLAFNGADYVHRWSRQGQHEFTTQGDEDLSAWKDMVTINVHDRVRTGDGLADLANRVLGNYRAHGHIMRTLSKPRTETSEAEHFAVAVLQGANLFEVAFARLLLLEGRGVVLVYSKRFYGESAKDDMTEWFKGNATKIEHVLVSWNGMPSLEVLSKLPTSPR